MRAGRSFFVLFVVFVSSLSVLRVRNRIQPQRTQSLGSGRTRLELYWFAIERSSTRLASRIAAILSLTEKVSQPRKNTTP